ncbi:MAG: transglycosylase SLT domain-containing protein, partial [Pseudolabrys sp.]
MANFDGLYDEAGYKYNVDPLRIKAHAIQESGEDPTKTGTSGEYGLMQIMPGTAQMLGLSKSDAYTPSPAIDAAARYLAMLDAKHTDSAGNTNVDASTAAYNGSGPATAAYASSVRNIYSQLQQQGGLKLAPDGSQDGKGAEPDDPFAATLKAAPASASPPAAASAPSSTAAPSSPPESDTADPFAATLTAPGAAQEPA